MNTSTAISMQELMKPRYKVINTYPFNNHFMLNEIIVLPEFDSRSHISLQEWFVIKQPLSSAGSALPITMHESTFNQYPHLFQPLPWYAEREISDMPEYIRINDNWVVKVKKHFADHPRYDYVNHFFEAFDAAEFEPFYPYEICLPATHEEFINNTQTKQTNE